MQVRSVGPRPREADWKTPEDWPDHLSFRRERDGDRAFLCRLYASTREQELAVTGWDEGQKREFLQMQFEAQHSHYRKYFSNADFMVILAGEQPVGRYYLNRREREIRVIDIALLPEWRNRGLGSMLMRDLLQQARRDGSPVRLHVEKFNPALRLYERLGFRAREDLGVYLRMEWNG